VRQQQRQQFGFVAVFLAVAGLQLGARKKQLVATGLVRASALGSLVTHIGERDETPVQSSVDFCNSQLFGITRNSIPEVGKYMQ
jgi:hypothetical protein